MSELALITSRLRDNSLLSLKLNRPKANIVDEQMIDLLQDALDENLDDQELSAVLITAEGPNFSFGASVPEHLPEQCANMLAKLHKLVLRLIAAPVPVLCSVRGFCFGGGLEVALGSNMIFASPDANFAQPEISLAVFAPAASCLLPERIGQAKAEDLLFSGRSFDAETALSCGLVQFIDQSPDDAALQYFDKYLAPRSKFALRQAVRAARSDVVERMKAKLDSVERQYLEVLMAGHDPVEGLTAFIEKRPPTWEHR
ncbi:MAG: cyclohexa-1,5-dienecarbonyl-CoA hydratase [Gammaproteobacteria bacterium]|nr:cyclohexa-1,5-dienecarbonyl-CoA hydratase [Gammaproteobacteria bacterium]